MERSQVINVATLVGRGCIGKWRRRVVELLLLKLILMEGVELGTTY